MSARERMARLLFIVPYVTQRQGVPVDELAAKLNVKVKQIESDIALLSMVGQPPLTPDHLIDLYIEDGVVQVDLHQSLSRPLQLTHEEAAALVTSARLVGSLGGLGEELETLLARITAALNPVFQEQVRTVSRQVGIWQDAGEADHHVTILREAIAEGVEVEMEYYSASSDKRKDYRLEPIALIPHSGWEYLVANDLGAEGREKLFRLDRVGMVRKTDAQFTRAAEVSLERFRTTDIYKAPSSFKTEVRFAAAAADEAREQFGDVCFEDQGEGGLRAELDLPSPVWLARFILPFGTRAHVTGPESQREILRDLCVEAAEAYSRPL